MNLKLYGICFKLRGGPDLLDYVQTGDPVPVDIMGQVMTEVGSITPDEMAYAERLDADWKKAFNERVPMLMSVAPGGGYDIECTIPDEMLAAVRLLTGLSNEQVVEEYTDNYLKDICGIDAPIISVDIAPEVVAHIQADRPVSNEGFDLGDLMAEPEPPAFEDVSRIGTPGTEPVAEEPVAEEPAFAEPSTSTKIPSAEPDFEPDGFEPPEDELPPEEDELPPDIPEDYEEGPDMNDGGMDEDGMGEPDVIEPEDDGTEPESEEPEQGEPAQEEPAGDAYSDTLRNIYTELVGNIKEKKLDERLGLRIG